MLAEKLHARRNPPFDFTVVDAAQDISVAQLRFLAAMGGERPNGLFFAGDLGQRIFQTPFSWKSLGVDVRGRSQTLRINYRTSHQIRMQADRLLGPQVADVDGNVEDRRGTVSAFNGPSPGAAASARSSTGKGHRRWSELAGLRRKPSPRRHDAVILGNPPFRVGRVSAASSLLQRLVHG